MKKLFCIFLTLCTLFLISCSNCSNVSVEPSIEFQGEYVSNDQSTLAIIKTGEKYDVKISIVRLTNLDDGVGELINGNTIEFSATDAQGNKIKGKIQAKNQEYMVLEFTESTWGLLPNGTVLAFRRTEKNEENDEEESVVETREVDGTPYVAIYSELLDTTVVGYKNRKGCEFFGVSDPSIYCLKETDGVRYLYGTDETVIGAQNNDICVLTRFSYGTVRDAINLLEADQLFEVLPAVQKINGKAETVSFFYWRIQNGYIGFVTIGGDDPQNCYSYSAHAYILFEDLNTINIAGNIQGIRIELVSETYYQQQKDRKENDGKIEIVNLGINEDCLSVCLSAEEDIQNLKIFSLVSENLTYSVGNVLYTKNMLHFGEKIILRIDYLTRGAAVSLYGLSYTDKTGTEKKYLISESYEDGSALLKEF